MPKNAFHSAELAPELLSLPLETCQTRIAKTGMALIGNIGMSDAPRAFRRASEVTNCTAVRQIG